MVRVPQIYLFKVIQAKESNLASWSESPKAEHCEAEWVVLPRATFRCGLDHFYLHRFTSCCYLQKFSSSQSTVSPGMALTLPFLGSFWSHCYNQADVAAFITEIRNVETDVMGTGCWRAGNSWDTLRGSEDESFISWVFFCGLKVINWKTHFFNGYMLQSWFVICWGNETSQQAGAYRRESEGDEISWSHRAESKWIPERKNYTVLSQGWDQLPPTSTRNWGKIIGREKKWKIRNKFPKTIWSFCSLNQEKVLSWWKGRFWTKGPWQQKQISSASA